MNQSTQLVDRRDLSTPSAIMAAAQAYLKNFNDRRGMPTSDSSLFAAIQDLLMNLPFPGLNIAPQGMNPGMNIPNQGMNASVMPGQNFPVGPMGPQNPQMNPQMGGMPQMVPNQPGMVQPMMNQQQYGNMGMSPMPGGPTNEGNN